MKYYVRISTEQNSKYYRWFTCNPLRIAVVYVMASRAKFKKSKILNKGEFLFSAEEVDKFGLAIGQKGRLQRIIDFLCRERIIVKTDRSYGKKHSSIYRFLPNEFIDGLRSEKSRIGSELLQERGLKINEI